MNDASVIGVIGGTGVRTLGGNARSQSVQTPYGTVDADCYDVDGGVIAFITRHGKGHTIAPHKVNYRANIWALHHLGAHSIIATAAVGSLRDQINPGDLVICSQFLDFTRSRPATFFEDDQVVHTDVTHPYCSTIRTVLASAAQQVSAPVHFDGCYVCVEGPRYETAAETNMFGMLGGDVVGMTGVPEVVLARELNMCFGLMAITTNLAPGLKAEPVNHEHVEREVAKAQSYINKIISRTAGEIIKRESGCCKQ